MWVEVCLLSCSLSEEVWIEVYLLPCSGCEEVWVEVSLLPCSLSEEVWSEVYLLPCMFVKKCGWKWCVVNSCLLPWPCAEEVWVRMSSVKQSSGVVLHTSFMVALSCSGRSFRTLMDCSVGASPL